MDLGSLGIEAGIIVGIVGITEYVKGLDKENKFKRFYMFIPAVLAIAAGIAKTVPLELQNAFLNAIKYFGITSFSYNFVKKVLLAKMQNAIKQAENTQEGK